MAVGAYGERWLEKTVRPSDRTFNTTKTYANVIRRVKLAPLGSIRVQRLTIDDVEDYLRSQKAEGLSATSVAMHKMVLSTLLKRAMRDEIVRKNVASLATGLGRRSRHGDGEAARTQEEARAVVEASSDMDAQICDRVESSTGHEVTTKRQES